MRPSVGVAIATARAVGLERPIRALLRQTRSPDQVCVVAEGDAAAVELPASWTRVTYSPPPYYAEEMALNAAADAVDADVIVLLADMTELDPDALEKMVSLLRHAPLVSGAYCAHDPIDWHEIEVLPPDTHGLVDLSSGQVFCMLTGIWQHVWRGVNGLDERFAGANGYQDTNLARRVEKAYGKCWVESSLRAHRAIYTGVPSLQITKPKLYSNRRNMVLDEKLAAGIARGETRAWRSSDRMIPPKAGG